MPLWQQIGAVLLGVMMLFMLYPALRQSLQKSREASETHWGTVLMLAAVLIAFIMLLIHSVR